MARKRGTVKEKGKAGSESRASNEDDRREDQSGPSPEDPVGSGNSTPHEPAETESGQTTTEGKGGEEGMEDGERSEAGWASGGEDGPHASHEPQEGGDEKGLEEVEAETIEGIRSEMARLRDQHLRLAADFENYRKRVSADLAGSWDRAQAELARSLLEGLDDLQRVSRFTSEDTTVEALIEGVDLVERKLFRAMAEAGLEALEPVGERFDPNIMEAVMRVPVGEDGEDESVQDVFQKGYRFKDLLIRPARVSVFKDDD
jgi:molecular chaperone GrpE